METILSTRTDFYTFDNGEKPPLQFSQAEYDMRLNGLREIMSVMGLEAVILTSMHCVSYYTGFTYCSFGRPYACIVTHNEAFTISAGIDGGQPARRSATKNIIYSDWKRDNFWRAVKSCIGNAKVLGIEGDHITIVQQSKLNDFLNPAKIIDIAPASMKQRMIKSNDELELIRKGAKVADIGGFAIHDAISVGAREIDVAMAGRDAMELEIAKSFPDSELRDTWVWFQSGVNTDGAHNPVTTRKLVKGDILSLNTFPMISGYYTALERTLFIGEPNKESLKIWEANIQAHELGLSLIKEGAKCSGITEEINSLFERHNLLQYRSFGYGHSFGVLSHYYGREAGLELREDIDTELTSNMVVSMEPMITIPDHDIAGGGYREHDILVLQDGVVENITKFPYGPEHNIINA
ncbi:aminopeptidase P family protein [Amylibacter sp.]|nr:aminopeptidase P family protein [Amylibacter sp.]MDB0059331.1 aminopeptidase P family protein [bacterium]MDB4117005.1 aminopeptidase P family protein [Amylibacter sp.]MDB9851935.1 aminopeptidase P family protein [Amylibacter sp.]